MYYMGSIVVSIRIPEEDALLIKKKYGSISRFVKEKIKEEFSKKKEILERIKKINVRYGPLKGKKSYEILREDRNVLH